MSAMEEDKIKTRMNFALMRLFNEVLTLEEIWLKNHGMTGLTMAEMHMLVAIRDRENGAMSDLARQSSLTNGTVTTTVKRLEKKGYVCRARDVNDTRKLRVRLTETGAEAVVLHDHFHDTLSDIIWERLGSDSSLSFVEGITTIMDFLQHSSEVHDENRH